MTEQNHAWEEMARQLWEEQAKEQLAELQEEMAGQPEKSLTSAIQSLEERLEKKLKTMTSSPSKYDENRPIAEQMAEQIEVVKQQLCYACGQPITENPSCNVCATVSESIATIYSNIEKRRQQRETQITKKE